MNDSVEDEAAAAYKALMGATNKYNQFAAMAQQAGAELEAAQREAGVKLEAWLIERGDLPRPEPLNTPNGSVAGDDVDDYPIG